MNFISKTLHRILKSLTPKNWKFFSLFLCMFAEFLDQLFDGAFVKHKIKGMQREHTSIFEEATPTKTSVHACYINPYLHEFFKLTEGREILSSIYSMGHGYVTTCRNEYAKVKDYCYRR